MLSKNLEINKDIKKSVDVKEAVSSYEPWFALRLYYQARFRQKFEGREIKIFENFWSDDGYDGSSGSSSEEDELEICEAAIEEAAAEDGEANDSNGDGNLGHNGVIMGHYLGLIYESYNMMYQK